MSISSKVREIPSMKVDLRTGEWREIDSATAIDVPVMIYLNGEHLATTVATPEKLKELAVGFLIGQGILRRLDEISDLWVRDLDVMVKTNRDVRTWINLYKTVRAVLEACGEGELPLLPRLLDRIHKPRVEFDDNFSPETLMEAIIELNRRSTTPGAHSALVFSRDGGIHSFAEDVGRHNAVDKALGEALIKGLGPSGCALALTGRVTGSMVLKCARFNVPLIISILRPLYSGIRIAEEVGITLIGLARGRTLNLYTHAHRVR
jgi:FdhD protein